MSETLRDCIAWIYASIHTAPVKGAKEKGRAKIPALLSEVLSETLLWFFRLSLLPTNVAVQFNRPSFLYVGLASHFQFFDEVAENCRG